MALIISGSDATEEYLAQAHARFLAKHGRSAMKSPGATIGKVPGPCRIEGGRPCEKCGENVCVECRFTPRVVSWVPWQHLMIEGRPLRNTFFAVEVLSAHCPECEKDARERIRRKYPDIPEQENICDYDLFSRWVCPMCRFEEKWWAHSYSARCYPPPDDEMSRLFTPKDGFPPTKALKDWASDGDLIFVSSLPWLLLTCNADIVLVLSLS
jgi:hypothetical protein